MFVAQTVAHCGKLQSRHGIEEASGQTAKPAVAEPRVGLLVENLHPLAAVFVEGSADHGIEHEVHDVIGERSANEEFDRDVIDALGIFARVGLIRLEPSIGKNISDRPGGRFIAFASVRGFDFDDIVEFQMPLVERVRRSGKRRRSDAILTARSPRRWANRALSRRDSRECRPCAPPCRLAAEF